MSSILQDWVVRLGLRHQGVLLSSVRGCDTVSKTDPSKDLVRCLRDEMLIPFCRDPAQCASFIESVSQSELRRRMVAVLKNGDHLPSHYIGHLMHSAEIIGYKKPSQSWLWFYEQMCSAMHLNLETEEQLDNRLNAPEEDFARHQPHTNPIVRIETQCPKCRAVINYTKYAAAERSIRCNDCGSEFLKTDTIVREL